MGERVGRERRGGEREGMESKVRAPTVQHLLQPNRRDENRIKERVEDR